MIKAEPSPNFVIKFMCKLLLFNWLVSACRISLIIMIYVFKDIFLAKNVAIPRRSPGTTSYSP